LPNRLLLADRLHQAISAAKRQGDSLAVVYIDLDGFKAVNDNHGHDVGDQLLKKVSSRMRAALRENDTLARLGGDEFVAVLSDLNSEETCHAILSRMLAAAAKPVQIHQTCEVQVSASLGVSLFPQAEVTEADQLLRQADHAMYQAKITGKNRYHFFDKEEDKTLKGRYDSLQNIRKALEAREFILLYQPKVNLRLREVVGFEALIRWQHPEAGLLPPSAFLPMVENDPLSIDLGDWAIGEALAQMEAWQAFGIALPVSVNISALQLQQQDFVERLQQRLADHPNVKPEQLELEILETSALEDISHASSVMTACQKIGVGFALDDFGTGYSSLNYLKNLPAKQLKIDQSFIRNMLDDAGDLAITQGVIGLASAFRRQVIAEGMETAEHAELLLCLGCEQAQGYAISHPMKADQIPNWLAAWRLSPARSRLPQVATEDLPLLLAIVRFRSWYRSLETSLEDELPELALNILESPLGDWFAQQSGSPNKHLPSLQEGKYAYAKIHGLAESLLVERELDHERRVRELLLEIREHSKRLLQLLLACKQQLSEEASEA
jgi:diguanylate cyclase (GGDEF)-like protein